MRYITILNLIVILFVGACKTDPEIKEKVLTENVTKPSRDSIEFIKHGYQFGMCAGYCFSETIFEYGKETSISKSWEDTVNSPTIINGLTLLDYKWNLLINSIELDSFFSLNKTIGCPDCTDGGEAWVEIQTNGRTHKVSYDYHDVPSILTKMIGLINQDEPIIEIQQFTSMLDSIGLISDSARLNKVAFYGLLKQKNIVCFNNQPFYKIDFEDTNLSHLSKSYNRYSDSIDIALFEDSKAVWGYFYREKEDKELISDGVIEEWRFENEEKAEQALEQLRTYGKIVYFNTNPYFVRVRNSIVVFQTRAMSFSFDQKLIFKMFVNNLNKD